MSPRTTAKRRRGSWPASRNRPCASPRSPGIGRPRAELQADLRSFPVGRYVLFYRPIKGGIEVARVLHGMRDLDRIFGEGEEG